mmetsp:Transcript_2860/g.5360  ORF Transcript_2860/g.5360 Transcript_2860/m.5360 type:complete len:2050 (+) Transcript_2860:305-6454(+)
MEVGAHVWLRSESSRWGWVPAKITKKEDGHVGKVPVINLTLTNDPVFEIMDGCSSSQSHHNWNGRTHGEHKAFETIVTVDPEQLKTADHEDIKLRNMPRSYQLNGGEESPNKRDLLGSPSSVSQDESVVGGVDDLIGLTHLHEPAILHALRLRYNADIIYTATGPILIAVNPFKDMPLYTNEVMTQYRLQGEKGTNAAALTESQTPFKRRTNDALIKKMSNSNSQRLPPHAYQTADDAYRAMMRGMENKALMYGNGPRYENMPTNQSILVSGESGAGKTVTTKIVLNYLAMLSKVASQNSGEINASTNDRSIEQQVLQSNPILESFGNARTIRNDNSSRFGKYIDIQFSPTGRLTGASIETYLLEKVRLIHPGQNERNYHVFYEFLRGASREEKELFFLQDMDVEDFLLLNHTGEFGRRDGVSDKENHRKMREAMVTMGFSVDKIQSLMRLVTAILWAGNMRFVETKDDACYLVEDDAASATAALLGVNFEDLASALTSRTINTVHEKIEKALNVEQAIKAREALIKAVYGGAFDYIVEKVNKSIHKSKDSKSGASIGVLDIFGFETFASNNFEQLCINYTNEALQQQFNKYVFKLEQLEYEKEGILWKYISFPDNQDVLDLIDMKHTGILAILDEQCIIPQSTDEKFTRYLYSKADNHKRFSASSAQRVRYKFSIEHYAGAVEYNTKNWLEKNKDQLPAKSAALLKNSSFNLLGHFRKHIRSDDRNGRGTVITKSVGAQFSEQLKTLRKRIDVTTPHYIRCLKPNDDLAPNTFEPNNIVEQLRCGGVLEAVRVSRAGYPTRYPHDVFFARYYILGDSRDKSPLSPIAHVSNWTGSKEEKLKRLISKIAYDIWEADQQMLMNILEAERAQNEMQSPAKRKSHANTPVFIKGSSIVNGPQSLAVESSVQTPPEKRDLKKRKQHNRLSLLSMKERAEHSQNLERPQSRGEFLSLDFVSRCAVAGLQLGRTKVFLRREAFDRIEAMRSGKFFGSAVKIQSMVRGKICRTKYLEIRAAAIKIQSVLRISLSKNAVRKRKHDVVYAIRAAVIIQRAFRTSLYTKKNYTVQNNAAILIQTAFRGFYSRNMYFRCLWGIISLQALHRGRQARAQYLHLKLQLKREEEDERQRAAAIVRHSPIQQQAVVPIEDKFDEYLGPPVGASIQDLYRYIHQEDWTNAEKVLDKNPSLAQTVDPESGELPLHVIARHNGAWALFVDLVLVLNPRALAHRDNMGALPIHHAAANNNVAALEIIYDAYKDGVHETDNKGRLPLHVASQFDAVDAVKFLLAHSSEGAFTMITRPVDGSGGGLPLHVACRNYASIGVITALLAENFASAKRADENGDLPLHLLLKCGEKVDPVVVKTLLTCFAGAASRTDMNGDLPLCIAIKNRCKPTVINHILMQYPNAASTLNGDGQSPLHLAFEYDADDRTILGLLNHAPEFATLVDKKTGLMPIQVATQREHTHFIVHNLLKRDMPIDLDEKVRAQLLPHHYSWNHIVSHTNDLYHQVVTKVLQQCTQPQVLALAHVEDVNGKIALATATTVCKHEIRVMLRLFNTLEVVNQRPAYTNPISDTQIFYALRYEPPTMQSSAFTVLHEEKRDRTLNNFVEDYDDMSVTSALSRQSIRSTLSSRSQQSVDDKLRQIRKEKGQQVIAKLTSRSDVVERELRVRKDYHLSRHYVPAIISVHHTVQHAAYSEAMAEPGYCITMEGADTTAENLMLDLRKIGKPFPVKALKRIGISLLHMHEHNLVHCDFGTHNVGKFGNRWKLLGVGGSVPIGKPTNPNRGFYHPPESIIVENKRAALGKKAVTAVVVSIPARPSYDVWAYGVVLYEAISGIPLAPYACRGKRAMSSLEVAKIGEWDEQSMKKALRHLLPDIDDNARSIIKKLLHYDPEERFTNMRQVLEHPFFASTSQSSSSNHGVNTNVQASRESESLTKLPPQDKSGNVSLTSQSFSRKEMDVPQATSTQSLSSSSQPSNGSFSLGSKSRKGGYRNPPLDYVDENSVNGASRNSPSKHMDDADAASVASSQSSRKSRRFGNIRNPFSKNKRQSLRG